jgi:hypothetical protein
MQRGKVALAALAAIAAASGCGRDLRESIAQHRGAVEARIDAAKAAAEVARRAPRVTTASVTVGEPKPFLLGPGAALAGNTAVAYLEDFADVAELGPVPHRLPVSGILAHCAAALTTHREPYDPTAPSTSPPVLSSEAGEALFAKCEALRYLVVIRTVAFAPPVDAVETTSCAPVPEADDLDAGTDASADAGPGDGGAADAGQRDAGAKATATPGAGRPAGARDAGPLDAYAAALGVDPAAPPKTCLRFEGGFLRAEAFLFDLGSRALLGSFPFDAESAKQVDVASPNGSLGTIEADFAGEIRLAFRHAVEGAMPGVDVGGLR